MNVLLSLHLNEKDPCSVRSHDGAGDYVPCEWVSFDGKVTVHCDTPETAMRIARAFEELADAMKLADALRAKVAPKCPECGAPEPCTDDRCAPQYRDEYPAEQLTDLEPHLRGL